MKLKYFRSNNVDFVSIAFSSVTSGGFVATGAFNDYKSMGTAKGFSIKKHSSTTWTDAAVSAASFAKTYSGLDASTQYDVRMYVTIGGVKQYSAVFNVTTSAPAVTGISINKESTSIVVGATETLTATLTPVGATGDITWSSSDETKATVAAGVVTAIAEGSANITATCGEYTATCAVTVTAAENEDE